MRSRLAHAAAPLQLRACAWALLCALAWLAPALRARAFSDMERFVARVEEGGGGGRLFTGSPADGYACNVCHGGGPEPDVAVYGLPTEGYVPGQVYDIELVWDGAAGLHAMHVEIVNEVTGRAAGAVAQVDPATLDARGRCRSQQAEPADYALEAPGRQILGVQACGATSLRFRFAAPNLPQIVFAGSVVLSNSDATANGDGVQNLGRVLRRAGEPSPAESGCALRGAGRRGGGAWLALLLLLGAALRMRAR